MKRSEREVLLKLVIFCEKCNYNVKEVLMQKGSMTKPHIANVETYDNKKYTLEYLSCNGDWRERIVEKSIGSYYTESSLGTSTVDI